jgi:hypothetical protein
MRFHIPSVKDDTKAEEVYEAIRKFAVETTGWDVTDRRIFSIHYRHEGKEYHAEVGKPETRGGEVVEAILESNAYLVCTANRGVLRGMPILVGKNEIHNITVFKD